MPATIKHIQTNFARIETLADEKLTELLAAAVQRAHSALFEQDGGATVEATEAVLTAETQLTWKIFVEEADKAKVADRIPGTVGKTFAKAYGTAATRRPRGKREEIKVSTTFVRAAVTYDPKLEAMIEDGVLSFTNVRATAKMIEKAIAATRADIVLPLKESGANRAALTAVLKKVEALLG